MKNDYPERGERAKKNDTLRDDIKGAADKAKWCPTCGQKIGASGAVGGAGGGG
jgi:hypothetical protein